MCRIPCITLLGVVLLSGCAMTPAPGAPGTPGPTAVRHVDTGHAHVSTLLVPPTDVGTVAKPGFAPAELRIGAFYARFERSEGPVDQLALMLELKGRDALALLEESRELLLQVDGHLFSGRPGVSENSFRVSTEAGGTRATLAIPVTPDVLLLLSEAGEVRGRLGLWGSFTFPDACRGRLRDLLLELPADAPLTLTDAQSLTRVAKATD